eukprot:TRINITY_DN195_c0_g1_i1.p1 TRINITY_DN195_c0_g1~~TRINITY_DN195_c0_g1_i1.p1  ORF type:complete len:254 (+),score=61.16 TRINITY_DN195_c0_g1_i1:30-764(+)
MDFKSVKIPFSSALKNHRSIRNGYDGKNRFPMELRPIFSRQEYEEITQRLSDSVEIPNPSGLICFLVCCIFMVFLGIMTMALAIIFIGVFMIAVNMALIIGGVSGIVIATTKLNSTDTTEFQVILSQLNGQYYDHRITFEAINTFSAGDDGNYTVTIKFPTNLDRSNNFQSFNQQRSGQMMGNQMVGNQVMVNQMTGPYSEIPVNQPYQNQPQNGFVDYQQNQASYFNPDFYQKSDYNPYDPNQ